MKRFTMRKMVSLIGCIVLAAALAVVFTGCSKAPAEAAGKEISFKVEITDLDGNVTTMDLVSEKATIGEALQEKGILEGEEGAYGLYIKAVNGIELDWDRDQKYWAFYVDGEYALTGADLTELKEGSVYSFRPES